LRIKAGKRSRQRRTQARDQVGHAYCCRLIVVPWRTGDTYALTMLS
jgi:hypothetical protein